MNNSGYCPICGNHFEYGIVVDGICEECYINQQTIEKPDDKEWWLQYGFKSEEEYDEAWNDWYENRGFIKF